LVPAKPLDLSEAMSATPGFGDVVDANGAITEQQVENRQYGNSTVSYNGSPTVYKPGDVVHLPYESSETSTMEAIGLAWAAYSEGIPPQA
jgi:hypothetical protein